MEGKEYNANKRNINEAIMMQMSQEIFKEIFTNNLIDPCLP